MGFLKILRDSAKVCGDSQGFSGFPQKPNEVSGVERVKVGVKVDPYRRRYDFQPGNEGLLGATKRPSGTPHEGAPNNHHYEKRVPIRTFFLRIFRHISRISPISSYWDSRVKILEKYGGKKVRIGTLFSQCII